MFVRLALALAATGCYRTVHRPSCAEVDRVAVAEDEVTPAGTAADLRAQVALDEALPGEWMDGSEALVDVAVTTSGTAEWVETEESTVVTRSFGMGSMYLTIAVMCGDSLEVPIAAEVSTADGSLFVPAKGVARATVYDDLPIAQVDTELYGDFGDAVFPVTEEDPADWDEKSSFVSLDHADGAWVGGTAGWSGERVGPDVSTSHAEYVVDFWPPQL